MMDQDQEHYLAETFARRLDDLASEEDSAALPTEPALAAEFATIEAIDRILGATPETPTRLSGHRIVRELGSGGMGVVYLSRDDRLGREVAIKTLSPKYAGNLALRARFMREARAMARISHPNIARIYSLGGEDEPPHFVMEYVRGVPINEAAGRLTFSQKAELMLTVAQAVSHLHERGIIHRDLKPANILVDSDLSPKLLDFGLALDAGADPYRLSQAGEIAGTPHYLSPEQTHGTALDKRTDVFSLGVVFYELLTGHLPFEGDTMATLVGRIREHDPELPTQRNPSVPRGLQNICLKALEKDPSHRYESTLRMAEDLQRFLAGEAVLAEPGAYSRLIAAQVERHLYELEGWRRNQIISAGEYDALRRKYGQLADREDAWIMEARRLTPQQVALYLGMWLLAIGVAFLAFFSFPLMPPAAAIALAAGVTIGTTWKGLDEWSRGRLRVALAFLLAACALLPATLLIVLEGLQWLSGYTRGREDLEMFSFLGLAKRATNLQIFGSLVAALPASLWLRRHTRASVFTLVAAGTLASACLASLLLAGLVEWIHKDPGRFYLNLLPFAAVFLFAGFVLERARRYDDSRYVYPFGVLFTWAALSGAALFHQPWSDWLGRWLPWTRGQIEYLFIINAGIYLVLDLIFDRISMAQIRAAGKAFRFVIPGHVLTSLLLLGLSAADRWKQAPHSPQARFEARLFEWVLPLVACLFVFGSIPRQMKNFFASGLLFLAVGAVRLQQDYFKERALWPILLLVLGLALMLAAASYAPLRLQIVRIFSRREKKL